MRDDLCPVPLGADCASVRRGGKKRKKKKKHLGMNMEKSACVDDTKPRLPRRIWVLEVSIHHSQAQNLSTLTD